MNAEAKAAGARRVSAAPVPADVLAYEAPCSPDVLAHFLRVNYGPHAEETAARHAEQGGTKLGPEVRKIWAEVKTRLERGSNA